MSLEETKINYSENESSILNLKIGRCVAKNFNEKTLVQQLLETEFDICRLTVPSSDENAILKLEKTGFPYFYSGSITRYKTKIASLNKNKFIHNDIIYEKYDGTQNELLLQLLIDTWGSYPIGYYRSPYLNKLVTKETEIIAVFEFYKKHNLQKDFPNNTIMFMKHNNKYVGFFALNIVDDSLESHIGGIVEPYRKDGYFFDMQEYIRRFCIEKKLNYFIFGARNENKRVNEIFQKFGYTAVGADNVFHIASLLSHNTLENKLEIHVEIISEDLASIYIQIYEKIKSSIGLMKNSIENLSFKINNLNKIKKEKYTLSISSPTDSILIIKIFDVNKNLISFGYVTLSNY